MRTIVVICAVLVVIAGSASLEQLSAQPHTQCAACLAVAEVVGKKMNETARLKSTFQASHRLDATNKVKRIDYESSELRAVEILDNICDDLKDYAFRLGEGNMRLFSSNTSLPRASFYGKSDRKELRSVSKKFKEICMEITNEQDEIIISLIKKVRELEALQVGLCHSEGFKVCGTKKAEASRQKERERFAKWSELKKAKEEKERKAAERKKREEEAKKLEEEAKKLDEERRREEARQLEEQEESARKAADPTDASSEVEQPLSDGVESLEAKEL